MKTVLENLRKVANVGAGVTRPPTYTGAPVGTRTPNLLIRSQALCPIELRGRGQIFTSTYGICRMAFPYIWGHLECDDRTLKRPIL